MTDNLFRWNQTLKKLVNVIAILGEQKVVQGVKMNMNIISSVNTVMNDYFCCANIFRL